MYNGDVTILKQGVISLRLAVLVQESAGYPIIWSAFWRGVSFKLIYSHSLSLACKLYSLYIFERNISEVDIQIYTLFRRVLENVFYN